MVTDVRMGLHVVVMGRRRSRPTTIDALFLVLRTTCSSQFRRDNVISDG